MLSLGIAAALLLDRVLGEVPRYHPLVGFGSIANRFEALFGRAPQTQMSDGPSLSSGLYRAGAIGWLVLVGVPTVFLFGVLSMGGERFVTLSGIVVLYFCIGGRSLAEHARAVARPLSQNSLDEARQNLARIVSRDTKGLDAQAVTNATIESVLENGSDAVLAPLFWFAIAGAPGALAYRLSNTLDAMWGYPTQRYLYFGCAAARMDDVLNWLPSRLCALSYAMVGTGGTALRCWWSQAPLCASPNAGPVMAAGAGALGVVVGGPARYGGESQWRPWLGRGAQAGPRDIERAIVLVQRATGIWWLAILLYEATTWI